MRKTDTPTARTLRLSLAMIAALLGDLVALPSSATIAALLRRGLITFDGQTIELTDRGHEVKTAILIESRGEELTDGPVSTAPAYRVLGTTDDVTACELCGREELRGTIVLQPLDSDGGHDGDPVHYGAVCGAKAAGWSVSEIRDRANRADRERREAERAERQRQHDEEWAAFLAGFLPWVRDTYGVQVTDSSQLWDYCGEGKPLGRTTPFRVQEQYRAALTAAKPEPAPVAVLDDDPAYAVGMLPLAGGDTNALF